jgi:protein-disulfide isomerase
MTRSSSSILVGAALIAVLLLGPGVASVDAGKKKKDKEATKEDRATLSTASDATAAFIDGEPVSVQEVDERAAGRLMKVRQQEFEVRNSVLTSIISDRLLDREAAAQDVSREKLLEQEVASKVPEPTDAEINNYYNRNKKRYGQKTLDQVKPQVVTVLRSQKLGQLQRAYVDTLRKKYEVKVLLEPPRVEVAMDDDAFKGPEGAPVTIVEFSDYQCPYCSRAEVTIAAVLKKYGDSVRLVYRDYPLGFHKNAQGAAEAAECAEEQGKFWEMHEAMFANQAKLASEQLVETAGSLGLDSESFKECLESGKYSQEVKKDFSDGQKYGVTGTPTFFINGIMMVGAKGVDAFSQIIDLELERNN